MGLLDFPSPVDWLNAAKNGAIERQAANALMSAAYSSWITGMWASGSSKWATWFGEGPGVGGGVVGGVGGGGGWPDSRRPLSLFQVLVEVGNGFHSLLLSPAPAPHQT